MKKVTKSSSRRMVLKAAVDSKKMVLINLKIDQNELDRIKVDANKYYLGNLSAWIRYCCLNYKPNESELTTID